MTDERSPVTEAFYQARHDSLMDEYLDYVASEGDGKTRSDDYVRWLLEVKFPLIRQSTRRLYRSASLYAMELQMLLPGSDPKLPEAIRRLRDAYVPPTDDLPPATSHGKRKIIGEADSEVLMDSLAVSGGKLVLALLAYLLAALITALRPCEWARVKVVRREHDFVLIVRNAKWRPGYRAHRQFRRLIWPIDAEFEIKAIESYVKIVDERLKDVAPADRKAAIDRFNEALRHALRYHCRKVWGKRTKAFCLYATRHTASARWKRTMNPVEVAALMGHLFAETPYENYARAPRKGGLRQFCLPMAHPRDIAAVRSKPRDWQAKISDARSMTRAPR